MTATVAREPHADPAVAEELRALMAVAYAVEARLLGVADFAPLRRTAAHVAATDAEFVGIREDGVLVAAAELERPEPAHTHIGALVVRPDRFRRGLASALLAALVRDRFADALTVSTGAANTPAVRLYERHGFAIERHWATPDGIPMVTLRRGPASGGSVPSSEAPR